MKKVLIWLALIIFFAVGGTAVWFKMASDSAPQEHEDPGIPADLEIPEDIPVK